MLQPITYRTTQSISHLDIKKISFKYFNKEQNLKENLFERLCNAIPKALSQLFIEEGESPIIELMKQIHSDVKSDQFDEPKFNLAVKMLEDMQITPELCPILVKSIVIGSQIEAQIQQSQSYFSGSPKKDFIELLRENIKTFPEGADVFYLSMKVLENTKIPIFMDTINSQQELDDIVSSYPMPVPHLSEEYYLKSLWAFLMAARHPDIRTYVEEKATLEKFIQFLESRNLNGEPKQIEVFCTALCEFLVDNPFGIDENSFIRIIRIIGKMHHSETLLLNLTALIFEEFETASPLLKKEFLLLVHKMPWEQSLISQAALAVVITHGKLGDSEEDLETGIHLISRFDLNDRTVQNTLFSHTIDDKKSILMSIAFAQNCSFDKKIYFLNQIFSLLENKKIQLNPMMTEAIIRFSFEVPLIFRLIREKNIEFKKGIDFINQLMNENPLYVMKLLYIARPMIREKDPRIESYHLFFENRFQEMVLSKLSPETMQQICVAFTIENPSEFFMSLYSLISFDANTMILLDDEYMKNLTENRPSDLNRFCYLSKSEHGFFELKLEGNRPGLQEIFQSFPELNSFYRKHENSKIIANIFRKLNLEDTLPAFEEALMSDKSSVKFISDDKSIDDTPQQEKFAALFSRFLTDPSKILASGGTSMEKDAQLGHEILVTDEFLSLIFSSFEDSDSLSLVEKSKLLFALSSVFYQLSSAWFFGTENNSLKSLRNMALGLLNRAVEINPDLIAPELWSKYASRSLGAIINENRDRVSGCTAALASDMLLQVEQMANENPNSIVSGLIPIAWKAN